MAKRKKEAFEKGKKKLRPSQTGHHPLVLLPFSLSISLSHSPYFFIMVMTMILPDFDEKDAAKGGTPCE